MRQFTNLGLGEAKAQVEAGNAKMLEAVSKEVANDAKAKLEAAGAVVELK
jgi:large subunit ribosomal protein L7/L12